MSHKKKEEKHENTLKIKQIRVYKLKLVHI